MVTSKDAGLTVPDWPNSYGYNMFAFPVSRWVGGMFFEHTHRLLASVVGLLTVGMAVWFARAEPRRWVRSLGYVAVGAVILQGVLGGLRVTMLRDWIGIFARAAGAGVFGAGGVHRAGDFALVVRARRAGCAPSDAWQDRRLGKVLLVWRT